MPTLKIDGQTVTVPEGTPLIEAAKQAGRTIPHYCYHPGLPVAGNCRICLVDVEGAPRPQISCYIKAADGMVVRTDSPAAEEARKNVLEFLLANHPLDCPVCDQSGECKLQDYYMEFGQYDSRFREQKVKKRKAVPIGPRVMLDAERCILCSRCVRFTDHISRSHEFGIFNRGDHAEIGLYPGRALDNAYSGNTVDICPVGALTDRDFRFKCRVWYLERTKSICPGCSQGCNIEIHSQSRRPHIAEGARLMRLKPREHPDVNQWWICDEGRYGYKSVDEGRLTRPLLRTSEGLAPVPWSDALGVLRAAFDKLQVQNTQRAWGVLPGAHLSNEELWLIRMIFKDRLGLPHVDVRLPYPAGTQDDFLRKPDKFPNLRGALELGLTPDRMGLQAAQMIEEGRKGTLKTLYVFGHDLTALFGEDKVKALAAELDLLIYQGTNESPMLKYAHLVLPGAAYAEKDGTFTNVGGRVQRFRQAFPPIGEAREDWRLLLDVSGAAGHPLSFHQPAEIFDELAGRVDAFRGMTYESLGDRGQVLGAAAPPALHVPSGTPRSSSRSSAASNVPELREGAAEGSS